MIPDNVTPVLISGDKLEHILFKSAIYYAELGLNIWFISPQPFSQLPEDIQRPDKEVLKLITFLYLKDVKDLLTHLNGIHLWHKFPQLLIVNGYENYCMFSSPQYHNMNAAFVTASLLDATSACARKHSSQKAYLLVSCSATSNVRLNTLTDMYFPNALCCKDNAEDAISYIKERFTCT